MGLCWTLPAVAPAVAQSVTRTVGAGDVNTQVSGTTAFTVTSGTQQLNTLFHSFEDFSPGTANVLFQLNSSQSGVEYVIGRVTGGGESFINGQLSLSGGNSPDLFLINPSGITFGSNASLNLPGSFAVSTAESVTFGNGLEFSAIAPSAAPLLTITTPTGLQMGTTSGDIAVSNAGQDLSIAGLISPVAVGTTPTGLQLSNDNILAMIGRNVSLTGGIVSTTDGHISLGAVSANNTVGLSKSTAGWQLDYSDVSQFGDVTLSQRSLIDAGNIGSVELRGQNIYLLDGSVIFQENNSSQAAGQLLLQATDSIEMQGQNLNGLGSGVISDVQADGQGGDILLSARQILGRNDGMNIRSFTYGSGGGGDVTLSSTTLDMQGTDNLAVVQLRTLGPGNGGTLTINTATLQMVDAGLINNAARGTGNAGQTNINALESITMGPNDQSITVIGSSALSASGNAGEINITTPSLTLQGGAFISSSTYGAGNAGRVIVNASEQITVTGEDYDASTNVASPTQIRTAGRLLSSASRTLLGLPDAVTGSSGNIVLNTNVLSVSNNAEISVGHADAGSGGSIQVNANRALIRDGGRLLASTQSGNGGNIQLTLDKLLFMRNDGLINTESLGVGNGGNIVINSPVIAGFDNSDIVANAIQGNGGNINITTQSLLGLEFRDQLSSESDITASSEFGVNGTVAINNLTVDPALALVELPSTLADTDDQIATACEADGGNQFIASGRGGLPVAPNVSLHSNQPWIDIRNFSFPNESVPADPISNELTSLTEVNSSPELLEASEWQIDQSGNVELLAAASTHNNTLSHPTCLTRVNA
ncbi:MAG: filamentous hemagglutinin N-terminal domain-containing protein [Cyanobacteria bacterium J06623_5]